MRKTTKEPKTTIEEDLKGLKMHSLYILVFSLTGLAWAIKCSMDAGGGAAMLLAGLFGLFGIMGVVLWGMQISCIKIMRKMNDEIKALKDERRRREIMKDDFE